MRCVDEAWREWRFAADLSVTDLSRVRSVNTWLNRARYSRRMGIAHFSLPLGSLFVLLSFGAGRWDRSGRLLMFLLVTGFALAVANPVLLSLIRCCGCGLRVHGLCFSRA